MNYSTPSGVLEQAIQSHKNPSGSASIVHNGRFNAGLYVDGNYSYIHLGNLGPLNQGIAEAWLKYDLMTARQPIRAVPEYHD
jgi:hypothetical protein